MLHLQPPGLFFGAYMNMPNAFIAKCGRSLKAPPGRAATTWSAASAAWKLAAPCEPASAGSQGAHLPLSSPRYYPHAIAQARGVPFPFLNVGLVGRSGA